MSEIDLETVGVFVGIFLVLIGVGVMIGSSSGAWTVEAVPSKTVGILVGGFVSVLGAILTLACLDKLDDVGRVLSDLWNGLVDAFRR